MLAHRLPTILPPLTFEEAIEITKIYSISGSFPRSIADNTAPVPLTSSYGICGFLQAEDRFRCRGDSLAQYGVLFMDELPEYGKTLPRYSVSRLKTRRSPSRAPPDALSSLPTYACLRNEPRRCGYFGSTRRNDLFVNRTQKYISKVSGPLLDRIDMKLRFRQ